MKKSYNIRERVDYLLALLILPLCGVAIIGKPLAQYMEFPPLTQYVEHAEFFWPYFIFMALGIAIACLPFEFRILRWRRSVNHPPRSDSSFPWWGWVGIILCIASWVLAWSRFEWFKPYQTHTFSPLWLSYIIVINALTKQRTGKCMLTNRPFYTAGLFIISAGFWWFFEYLNRFVQNWYYVGIQDLSPTQYFFFATIPFSTVLPAVLGTYEFLKPFPGIGAGLNHFIRLETRYTKLIAWTTLVISTISLTLIGVFPDYLFPLLWISPLLIITSGQALRGQNTIFSETKHGNWRDLYLLAMSALICGCFWEMWNYHSLAKWIYTVPFVGKFKIFEMPVLGFAGYLPFGLECAVIAKLFLHKSEIVTETEPQPAPAKQPRLATICCYSNTGIACILAVVFLILPSVTSIYNLSDPAMRDGTIPKMAWRLHRNLTPRYAHWARERVASKTAENLFLYDVPSTEWPMFGSVYYLWSTEALQKAWEKDNSLSPTAPAIYARETIDASLDLVLDPIHHTWVKTHWGDDYMHNKNAFFRTLIISAVISHANLTGSEEHFPLLKDQLDSLAKALDKSPQGVIEDYPNECYPIDIFMAIAAIKRGDDLLGTNHSKFLKRSIRAFEGDMLDKTGQIPYIVDAQSGLQYVTSRGTGNSYILIFGNELWPEQTKEWYDLYEKHFWQELWWASGFREFPIYSNQRACLYDVDSGPIIANFSPAANAFGIAAAKINGRLDHAYTLMSQVVPACWPLMNGALLGPQAFSDPIHAPYLGEACILFFLTQQPADNVEIITGGHIPACTYIALVVCLAMGAFIIFSAVRSLRRWRKGNITSSLTTDKLQFGVWVTLVITAGGLAIAHLLVFAVLALLLAQFIPQIITPANNQSKGTMSCG